MIEPMSCCFKKSDLLLAVVAAAAGFYFFSSLAVLWPLADIDLHIEPSNLIAASRSFLESRGFDLTGYKARSRLTVNEDALDFLEIVWGLERTRQEIKKGLPVFHHTVFFKRYGSPETFQVTVYPGVGVIGFYRNVRKDDPGGTITRDAARARARLCLEQLPGPKNAPLRETGYEKHGRPDRTDYTFTFEHLVAKHPRVALNTTVTVTGLSVTAVERTLDIPSDILEQKRRKRAREEFLIASGVAVAAAATVLVFLHFLRYLRQG
ncbi:MAG: hypothetical protein QGH40_15750, partial [bacterium]|nr:hypothetical protein [bacterium]